MILSIVIVLGMTPFASVAETGEDLTDIPAGAIPLSSVDDLALIGYEYSLDSYFYLTQDIDMTAATSRNGDYYNDGLGWQPIGSASTPFTGTFDGRNHTITGMHINRADESYIGFIASMSGTIKNLNFRESLIYGKENVGTVVGYGFGYIENCNILSGEVFSNNGETGNYVGGIAGYISSIRDCSSNAGVYASNGAYFGGIAGIAGSISNCKCSSTLSLICGATKYDDLLREWVYSFGGIAGKASVVTDSY